MIVGAGGHARVVVNLAKMNPTLEIAGIVDRSSDHKGDMIGGYRIVGTFADMPKWQAQGIAAVVLALGDNSEREKMMTRATTSALDCITLVHPTAILDQMITVGAGSVICAGAILTPECRVGRGVIINTGAIVDHECEIGDFAQISPGVNIAGRVQVGTRAMIGIGANILPRIVIGQDAIIGAGAVVTKDVPAGVTAVGCPAKIVAQ